MFENLKLRLALRQNFDGEWAGEIGTWVWSKLARGEAKISATALYQCEHANRVALGAALREAGSPLPFRNPFLIVPAALAGLAAAATPMSIHRLIFTSNYANKGVRRTFAKLARTHGDPTGPMFIEVGERHVSAFSTFRSRSI